MKITILYSGGLDSLIMKRYAELMYPQAEVNCVWFALGQEYEDKERRALPAFVEQSTLDLVRHTVMAKEGSESGQIYIPGRNLVLAVTAACKYLPDQIWLGALQGEVHDGATDKNWEFAERTNKLLEYVLAPFSVAPKVVFPLAEAGLSKLTAVEWALHSGISKEQILSTSSCLSGEDGNCGKCVVCFRRYCIFKQLGLEGEKYNVDPLTVSANKRIVKEMMFGKYYDDYRKEEILPALDQDWIDREIL